MSITPSGATPNEQQILAAYNELVSVIVTAASPYPTSQMKKATGDLQVLCDAAATGIDPGWLLDDGSSAIQAVQDAVNSVLQALQMQETQAWLGALTSLGDICYAFTDPDFSTSISRQNNPYPTTIVAMLNQIKKWVQDSILPSNQLALNMAKLFDCPGFWQSTYGWTHPVSFVPGQSFTDFCTIVDRIAQGGDISLLPPACDKLIAATTNPLAGAAKLKKRAS